MESDNGFEEIKPANPLSGLFWNILTLFLLLGIVGMLGLFGLIYTNPFTSLNPFPPPKSESILIQNTAVMIADTITPTITLTNTIFPPTWTPTLTFTPTFTLTVEPYTPTSTATETQTATTLMTATETALPTDRPDMPFALLGTPAAVSSTIIHAGSDCQWMGIGGQVLDMQDAAIVGITIELGGKLNGKWIDLLSLSGTALQYGTAGYEFTLSDQPIASVQSLWIQLLDQAGLALSNRVYFDTYTECEKNLVLITFKQVR
jgi:hypothetical protein